MLLYTYILRCTYVYIFIQIRTHIYIYIYMCMYIYIYTYIHNKWVPMLHVHNLVNPRPRLASGPRWVGGRQIAFVWPCAASQAGERQLLQRALV